VTSTLRRYSIENGSLSTCIYFIFFSDYCEYALARHSSMLIHVIFAFLFLIWLMKYKWIKIRIWSLYICMTQDKKLFFAFIIHITRRFFLFLLLSLLCTWYISLSLLCYCMSSSSSSHATYMQTDWLIIWMNVNHFHLDHHCRQSVGVQHIIHRHFFFSVQMYLNVIIIVSPPVHTYWRKRKKSTFC
jgi:hypothetical protein